MVNTHLQHWKDKRQELYRLCVSTNLNLAHPQICSKLGLEQVVENLRPLWFGVVVEEPELIETEQQRS